MLISTCWGLRAKTHSRLFESCLSSLKPDGTQVIIIIKDAAKFKINAIEEQFPPWGPSEGSWQNNWIFDEIILSITSFISNQEQEMWHTKKASFEIIFVKHINSKAKTEFSSSSGLWNVSDEAVWEGNITLVQKLRQTQPVTSDLSRLCWKQTKNVGNQKASFTIETYVQLRKLR